VGGDGTGIEYGHGLDFHSSKCLHEEIIDGFRGGRGESLGVFARVGLFRGPVLYESEPALDLAGSGHMVAMDGFEADDDNANYERISESLVAKCNIVPHAFDSFIILLQSCSMMSVCLHRKLFRRRTPFCTP
jgi:hypothetical protein